MVEGRKDVKEDSTVNFSPFLCFCRFLFSEMGEGELKRKGKESLPSWGFRGLGWERGMKKGRRSGEWNENQSEKSYGGSRGGGK